MSSIPRPEAIHIGNDDVPFVDIGDGSKLRVLQVNIGEGLWIIENVFQAGYEVQKHRHTGPVYGYTSSGAWKYLVEQNLVRESTARSEHRLEKQEQWPLPRLTTCYLLLATYYLLLTTYHLLLTTDYLLLAADRPG